MQNELKKLSMFLALFTVTVSFAFEGTNYLNMSGKKVIHPFYDPDDSISTKEFIELKADNGIPVWFGKDTKKVVCFTGVCRLAHLWLFWNGVGDYLGFQLNEKEPLTKTNHVEFSVEDYKKLHKILADTFSVLKNIKEEDLVDEFIGNAEIDAHTGATRASFKDDLVDNAAYTCYTLWHTVYGKTRTEIQNILEQRVDSTYLQTLLNENNHQYQKWAINYISKNPKYQSFFNQRIVSMVANSDNELAQLALNYLTPALLSRSDMQLILFSSFEKVELPRKFQIVWRLSQLKALDNRVVLFLLKEFEDQKISASMLTYVYKSIDAKNLENKEIHKKLTKFSKHKNVFVRNLTQRLLSEAKN